MPDRDFFTEEIGQQKDYFAEEIEKPMLPEKITSNPDVQLMANWLRKLPGLRRGASLMSGKSLEEIDKTLSAIPEPESKTLGMTLGKALPDIAMATPFMRGAGLIPKIPGLLKPAIGFGAFRGAQAAGEKEPIIPAAAGGFGSGLLFGGLGKFGATSIPAKIPGAERIGSAIGGSVAGAITGSGKEDIALQGALGALFPSERLNLGKGGRYTQRKTTAIRQKAKEYHNREVNNYGKMLEGLSKSGENIKSQALMERLTQLMKERGLYDPATEKWIKPLNSIDAQLVKSYEELLREYKQGRGEIKLGRVIDEYQNIKNSGGGFKEPTSQNRLARETADELITAIKPQIKEEIFQQGNQRYANFKNRINLIDKYFNIWGNPLETGKGEGFLARKLGTSGEVVETAKIIKGELGQGLKGAYLRSRVSQLSRNPLLRYGLLGYGLSKIGSKALE